MCVCVCTQEFEMDPEIKRELEKQTLEKIEFVKKEMGWEEEKHRIALEKLRSRCESSLYLSIDTFYSNHQQ